MKKLKNSEITIEPTTVVGRISQKADDLAGQVKQLKQEIGDMEMKALYYESIVRIAEKEIGIEIEKKFVSYPHSKDQRIAWILKTRLLPILAKQYKPSAKRLRSH
jgi:hypothetical protein